MLRLCLGLIPLAMLFSAVLTRLLISLGHRMGTLDSAGVAGQVKQRGRVPNTGGIALFLSVALPVAMLVTFIAPVGEQEIQRGDTEWREEPNLIPADLHDHVPGIAARSGMAWKMLACMLALHLLGLLDDRRPLGPRLKLAVMLLPALAVPLWLETRLLTVLDGHVGGAWLSILLTAGWVLVISNAMNFLDNMDGLCAGVTAIAAGLLLAGAVQSEQWFVAAVLALLVGGCMGFLVFNAPRPGGARIYLGDGGSLVAGFLLAFLTIRATYAPAEASGSFTIGLFAAACTPIIVLAVPLYDFCSVVYLRLRQGRSPMVGDLQHTSHRLVRLGLSRAQAVAVLWGFTALTGMSGLLLQRVAGVHAAVLFAQAAIACALLGVFEYAAVGRRMIEESSGGGPKNG